jgi:hypothetical protein
MADLAVLFTHVVASNAVDLCAETEHFGLRANCAPDSIGTQSLPCRHDVEGPSGVPPVTGRRSRKHWEPISGTVSHWQPHLPGSESLATHVSSDNEDKGRRLVREPDCHFSARPRTWGLARTEWM